MGLGWPWMRLGAFLAFRLLFGSSPDTIPAPFRTPQRRIVTVLPSNMSTSHPAPPCVPRSKLPGECLGGVPPLSWLPVPVSIGLQPWFSSQAPSSACGLGLALSDGATARG